MRVCHIISGDIWAGAEAQTFSLIKELLSNDEIDISVIIFNEGLLSQKLTASGINVKIIDEKGGFVQYIPPLDQWFNTIGNMSLTEGYYIK